MNAKKYWKWFYLLMFMAQNAYWLSWNLQAILGKLGFVSDPESTGKTVIKLKGELQKDKKWLYIFLQFLLFISHYLESSE